MYLTEKVKRELLAVDATRQIVNVLEGIVAGTELSDGAIVTAKLADNAVTAAKLAPGVGGVGLQSFEYVVSDSRGNDTTGDGSYGAPWATIQHALDTVATGSVVWVEAGVYAENVSLKSYIKLKAFENGTVQIGAPGASTIALSILHGTMPAAPAGGGVVEFEGITFLGGNGGVPQALEVDYAAGAAGARDFRCTFTDCILSDSSVFTAQAIRIRYDENVDDLRFRFDDCRIGDAGSNSTCILETNDGSNYGPPVEFVNCDIHLDMDLGAGAGSVGAVAHFINCGLCNGDLAKLGMMGGCRARLIGSYFATYGVGGGWTFAPQDLQIAERAHRYVGPENALSGGSPYNIPHGMGITPGKAYFMVHEGCDGAGNPGTLMPRLAVTMNGTNVILTAQGGSNNDGARLVVVAEL